MAFEVFLTGDAACDLEDLYQYLALHDTPGKADLVLARIEEVFDSLSGSPQRGTYPKELLALGIRDYREVFFKPYRVIYRLTGNAVHVMLIADGRRDMLTLLQRRLLSAE